MKPRFFYFFAVLFLSGFQARSQSSEIGFLLGTTSYQGELNPHLFSTDFSVLHPAAGVFYRRNWNPHYSIRLNGLYGHISGDDSHQSSGFANVRNLSFSSPVIELATLFEFNFFPFEKYGSPYICTPFIFTGLSFFYFNPSVYYNGQEYQLQKLQLEGTGYSKIQVALPMGIGVKARVGGWTISAEVGPRKASTDYLDNVSATYLANQSFTGAAQALANPTPDTTISYMYGRKRGNPQDKDWYMFVGLSFSHKVGAIRKHECERLMKDQ